MSNVAPEILDVMLNAPIRRVDEIIGHSGYSGYSSYSGLGLTGISGYSRVSGLGTKNKLGFLVPLWDDKCKYRIPAWLKIIKEMCSREYVREISTAQSSSDYSQFSRIIDKYKKVDNALIEMEMFYYEYAGIPNNSTLYSTVMQNILLQDPEATPDTNSIVMQNWMSVLYELKKKDGSVSAGIMNAILAYLGKNPINRNLDSQTIEFQETAKEEEKTLSKSEKKVKKSLLFQNFFVYLQKFFKY